MIIKRKWQQCPHSEHGTRWSSMYVTLNPKGYLSLSKFTFEKLGTPERVLLLYDAPTNSIGLAPTSHMTVDAFPIHVKSNKRGRVIYALRLLQEFNIRVPRSVRFMDPHFDDDNVLILDLNNTRPTQQGQNGRARTRAASSAGGTG